MKKKLHKRHRWEEYSGPETGCGVEYFYECSCGAQKYVHIDPDTRVKTVNITGPDEEDDFDHSDFAG